MKHCFAIAITVVAMHYSTAAQAEEKPKPGSKLTLTVNGVTFTFCYIPAGSFMMGSPESEKGRGADEKLHKVIISKPFYMLEHEVTQEQFGKEPSIRNSVTTGSHFKGAKLPVEDRGFPDGSYSQFAKELMKATGKKFRLPTDAEWEYACRAGTTTPFHCGNDLDSTMANMDGHEPYGHGVKGKFLNKTMEVKQFKPNAWGLYDMHGNVAELCLDYAAKGVDLCVDGITDPGAADPDAIKVGTVATLCEWGTTKVELSRRQLLEQRKRVPLGGPRHHHRRHPRWSRLHRIPAGSYSGLGRFYRAATRSTGGNRRQFRPRTHHRNFPNTGGNEEELALLPWRQRIWSRPHRHGPDRLGR